jgi:LmbE family N-acetylglucosaminyl deacetylase
MPSSPKTLLAILAHPDDETFGTGGTLALYASRGVAVHYVCATRGEVGDVDPKYMDGFSSIAERRESELRCAAGLLAGMPGSPDNQHPNALYAQPLEKVAAQIAHFFNLLKPQVVITFDPIGGYRHPDHIAIHQATVCAFEAVHKDPNAFLDPQGLAPWVPEKLYYQTISRTFMRFGVTLLKLFGQDPHHFGRNKDVDIASLAEVEFPINARINYASVAKKRDQAAACHASQGGGQQGSSFMGIVRRLTGAQETYMRAFPAPVPGRTEKDLFEGINY